MTTAQAPIKPRRVQFDWGNTPPHWVPGDTFTTHVINVLHLLLPAGEKWFCEVYRQALPMITDDRLRDDVKGFIGQEAIHGRAHSLVLDHLRVQGIDTTRYTAGLNWMFFSLLGDWGLGPESHAPKWLRHMWLLWRLSIIAAIEHFTCVLGWWIISDATALDRAGADPTMLDLLRWHGSEEVEHRAVAFDLYRHLGGGYLRRIDGMAIVGPVIIFLWTLGAHSLISHDPGAVRSDRPSIRRYCKVARKTGRLPKASYLLGSVPRYMRFGYHPLQEASTDVALSYLARSPAAQRYAA
jgi:uncharacterized protein